MGIIPGVITKSDFDNVSKIYDYIDLISDFIMYPDRYFDTDDEGYISDLKFEIGRFERKIEELFNDLLYGLFDTDVENSSFFKKKDYDFSKPGTTTQAEYCFRFSLGRPLFKEEKKFLENSFDDFKYSSEKEDYGYFLYEITYLNVVDFFLSQS